MAQPRDKFDVLIGAIALALLNNDSGPKVHSVVVLALVDPPEGIDVAAAVRTAVAAETQALGEDIPKLLRDTADRIDRKGGLGQAAHYVATKETQH